MQETTFFTQLLGITRPWFISKVDLEKAENRVDIYIQHSKGFAFPCPKCQRLCSIYAPPPDGLGADSDTLAISKLFTDPPHSRLGVVTSHLLDTLLKITADLTVPGFVA